MIGWMAAAVDHSRARLGDAAANDDLLGSLRDANEFVGQPAVLHVTAQRKHGVFVGEAFGAGASAKPSGRAGKVHSVRVVSDQNIWGPVSKSFDGCKPLTNADAATLVKV